MPEEISRRKVLKDSLLAAAGGVLAMQTASALPAAAPKPDPASDTPPAPAQSLPCGKIGKLSVSRVLLGGNLLTHFTHSRDLKYVYNLTAHYNTEERILQTLKLAEQHGINTLSVHVVPWCMDILRKHRKSGGKMQWIICPTAPVEGAMEEYHQQVDMLVTSGCEAIYLWGVHADKLISQGKIDMIRKAVDAAKEAGVPSGVGAHDLRVVEACEANKIDADFYIKTFHHHKYPSGPKPDQLKAPYTEHPGYWCQNPEKTIEVMKAVTKPWIAFKVMAAGAIPPDNAFRYAFDNGADHILAGMFDFEIEADAAIARDAVAKAKRERPWRS